MSATHYKEKLKAPVDTIPGQAKETSFGDFGVKEIKEILAMSQTN